MAPPVQLEDNRRPPYIIHHISHQSPTIIDYEKGAGGDDEVLARNERNPSNRCRATAHRLLNLLLLSSVSIFVTTIRFLSPTPLTIMNKNLNCRQLSTITLLVNLLLIQCYNCGAWTLSQATRPHFAASRSSRSALASYAPSYHRMMNSGFSYVEDEEYDMLQDEIEAVSTFVLPFAAFSSQSVRLIQAALTGSLYATSS